MPLLQSIPTSCQNGPDGRRRTRLCPQARYGPRLSAADAARIVEKVHEARARREKTLSQKHCSLQETLELLPSLCECEADGCDAAVQVSLNIAAERDAALIALADTVG